MKQNYTNAFGHSPISFQTAVDKALAQTAREARAPRARLTLRTALVAALVLVLMLGVAYAAARHFGLLEYFDQWDQITISDEARETLGGDGSPLAALSLDGVDIVITAAAADVRGFYLAATFTPTQGDTLVYDIYADPGLVTGDTPHTGRLLVPAFDAAIGEYSANSGDVVYPGDGSIVLVLLGEHEAAGETATIECTVAVDAFVVGQPLGGEDRAMEQLTLDVPVLPVLETRVHQGPTPLEALGITIDRMTMTRTALTAYYHIELTDDLAGTRDMPWYALHFELTDEQGSPLPIGLSIGHVGFSEDDVHYVSEGTLSLAALPETIYLAGLPEDGVEGVFPIAMEAQTP